MPRVHTVRHCTGFWLKALALLVGLLPLLGSGALTWESQRVSVEGKSTDGALAAQFHFKNTGDTTITITDIKASCGCTTTELTKRTYSPGEEGAIKASMTVGIRSGVQEKSILVSTDDAPNKPVTLWLWVNIRQLLTYSSEVLFWRSNEGSIEKSIDIGIASPLRLESLTWDYPRIVDMGRSGCFSWFGFRSQPVRDSRLQNGGDGGCRRPRSTRRSTGEPHHGRRSAGGRCVRF